MALIRSQVHTFAFPTHPTAVSESRLLFLFVVPSLHQTHAFPALQRSHGNQNCSRSYSVLSDFPSFHDARALPNIGLSPTVVFSALQCCAMESSPFTRSRSSSQHVLGHLIWSLSLPLTQVLPALRSAMLPLNSSVLGATTNSLNSPLTAFAITISPAARGCPSFARLSLYTSLLPPQSLILHKPPFLHFRLFPPPALRNSLTECQPRTIREFTITLSPFTSCRFPPPLRILLLNFFTVSLSPTSSLTPSLVSGACSPLHSQGTFLANLLVSVFLSSPSRTVPSSRCVSGVFTLLILRVAISRSFFLNILITFRLENNRLSWILWVFSIHHDLVLAWTPIHMFCSISQPAPLLATQCTHHDQHWLCPKTKTQRRFIGVCLEHTWAS